MNPTDIEHLREIAEMSGDRMLGSGHFGMIARVHCLPDALRALLTNPSTFDSSSAVAHIIAAGEPKSCEYASKSQTMLCWCYSMGETGAS